MTPPIVCVPPLERLECPADGDTTTRWRPLIVRHWTLMATVCLLIAGLVIGLLSPPLSAAEFFVAPAGNDAGRGTLQAWYRNITIEELP